MTIQAKDIGFILGAGNGFADGAAVAAGTGDATAKTGAILDYLALKHPLSAKILIPWTATLADTETISMTAKIEHGAAANLSDAAEYVWKTPSTDFGVLATSDGGSTEVGCASFDADLSGLKRYFRISVTPDLSASATDTAAFAACFVFGGQDEAP